MQCDRSKPSVSMSFSIQHNNFEFLSELSKNRGDRSKWVNFALERFREEIEEEKQRQTDPTETIRRICSSCCGDLLPLLNTEEKDDVLFIMRKCRNLGVRCSQYEVETVLKDIFPDHYMEATV